MMRNNLQFPQSKKSQQVSNKQQLQSLNLGQLDVVSGGTFLLLPAIQK